MYMFSIISVVIFVNSDKAARIPIPICVTQKIRELWFSDDYMSYKSQRVEKNLHIN